MAETEAPAQEKSAEPAPQEGDKAMPRKKKRRRGRAFLIALLFFIGVLVAARVAMPRVLRWYVNRTIDQNPLYDGKIGDIDVALWRGAYTIKDIRLVKTTGNVPVPFYSSRQLDLALQWDALLHGKLVGRVLMQEPELNFVDAPSDAQTQTGAGGPWLKIIQDLFPFRINRAQIVKGSIHFRAYQSQQPVDVYLSHLDANIDNLSNIRDQTAPLISTITAQGMAMDQANFEFNMKLDPFSYRPTFRMGLKLVGLDVTKTNALARSYGAFDFEKGYFDLVVEMDARHGAVEGYVKPLFRDLVVVSVQDVKEDNPVQLFWEAVVGTVTGVLTNQPRHQFGTLIPVRGDLEGGPQFNILATVGNVLRNAFIRAYLPRLNGSQNVEGLEFKPGSVDDPVTSAELNGR